MAGSTPGTLTNGDLWSAKQVKFLRQIAGSLTNGGSGVAYNTPAHYILGNGESQTIAADSVHSISFQVVSGSVDVSIDGGTAITYPTGALMNYSFSTLNALSFDFDVTTGSVLIQTLA